MTTPTVIDIPVLPETLLGHALQFIDMLRAANLLAGLRQGRRGPRIGWRLTTADGTEMDLGAGPMAPYAPVGSGPAVAVFVAPLHCADIPAVRLVTARSAALVRRLGVAADQGQLVCTLGNAAWLAAASPQLAHRRVALPWYYLAGFSRDHPDTPFAVGEGFCRSGPWLSAALPANLPALAAALVDTVLGPDLAQGFCAAMEPDQVRERAALATLQASHVPPTRDSTLARAIAWMEGHLEQAYSLQALAAAAAVSPRTLLRHFQQELGHSPLDHLHGLRCARARVLLEITLESVPTIALACGYNDPAAFRRIFLRHTGQTPSAYRDSHALRAPRRRWRVGGEALAPKPMAKSPPRFGDR